MKDREIAMKSREVIRGVLDEYQDAQVNIGSEMAREILAHKIYKELAKHYHIFKKNELIVKAQNDEKLRAN